MKRTKLLLLSLFFCISIFAQLRNDDVYKLPEIGKQNIRENINIPGFDGYLALKCDFHTHTVFSDGKVWPDMRVNEAWQQGLDAIAITDHIEYRPFKELVVGDHNESFRIAKAHGNNIGFIVIQGTEVTRSKPIGHLNALFINDANKMDLKEPVDVLREAKRQGAFILWNHPGWPDNESTLYPIHEELIKEGVIDGIEIFNHMEYYPITLDYANQYDLAFMGNSDIHSLITEDYGAKKLARPITLVFAEERTEESIKEALFAKRTAALFNNTLAGKEEILRKLFLASVKVEKIKADENRYEVMNTSDIEYELIIGNNKRTLPANKTIRTTIPENATIIINNCMISKDGKLQITL